MYSVDEALARILPRFRALASETIPLLQSNGRILAEDIRASHDIPAFASSAMDGFAVRAADVGSPPVSLRVVADIPAGTAPTVPVRAGEAARIMTGAPLPEGADAVVPVESTDQQFLPGEKAAFPTEVSVREAVRPGAFTRPAGEDATVGSLLLSRGRRVSPAAMGMLAAAGKGTVDVIRRPRVALISTGDELVGPEEPLAPGQIRDANLYTLYGLVESSGGTPIAIARAKDTLTDVSRAFRQALESQPDIIVSSAGVSVGAFDVVRAVIESMGAVDFWRVNVRPGKPLAVGHIENVPFFGLPGNPVSAMVTFELFVRPALLVMQDQPHMPIIVRARAAAAITSDGRRSYLRVRLSREGDTITASETGTQSSGALMSMVQADGLMIVPEGMRSAPDGTEFEVQLLRPVSEVLR
jgi:molybdopterin molybdotransferase